MKWTYDTNKHPKIGKKYYCAYCGRGYASIKTINRHHDGRCPTFKKKAKQLSDSIDHEILQELIAECEKREKINKSNAVYSNK